MFLIFREPQLDIIFSSTTLSSKANVDECNSLFNESLTGLTTSKIILSSLFSYTDNPFLLFGMTFDELPNLKIINEDCTLTITNTGEIENMKGVVINTYKFDGDVQST